MSHNLKSQPQKMQPFTEPRKGLLLGWSGKGYPIRKIFVKDGHIYGVTDFCEFGTKVIKLN